MGVDAIDKLTIYRLLKRRVNILKQLAILDDENVIYPVYQAMMAGHCCNLLGLFIDRSVYFHHTNLIKCFSRSFRFRQITLFDQFSDKFPVCLGREKMGLLLDGLAQPDSPKHLGR